MVIKGLDEALRMWKSGKSKAEIGKILGKDKKQVAKLLATAINNRRAKA